MIYVVVITNNKIYSIVESTGFERKQMMNIMKNQPVDILSSLRNIICKLNASRVQYSIYSIESELTLNELSQLNQNGLISQIITNGSKILG